MHEDQVEEYRKIASIALDALLKQDSSGLEDVSDLEKEELLDTVIDLIPNKFSPGRAWLIKRLIEAILATCAEGEEISIAREGPKHIQIDVIEAYIAATSEEEAKGLLEDALKKAVESQPGVHSVDLKFSYLEGAETQRDNTSFIRGTDPENGWWN